MRWNECSVLTKSMLSICNANNVANMSHMFPNFSLLT